MNEQEMLSPSSVPRGELGLVVLSSSTDLGRRTDRALVERRCGHEPHGPESYLIPVETPRFSNGEGKATLPQSVRGRDVYILADVGNYGRTYRMFGRTVPMGPDEHFQDIKRTIAALGGRAHRINVIMPFLYEGRQHRRKARESLDCAMALQELERMGVRTVITFRAHDPRVQNAVPLMGFENLYPTYYFTRALAGSEPEVRFDRSQMIVVAPDTGAMDEALYYASVLQLDVGLFYKRRDVSRVVNGRNPIVQHEYMGSDVRGKDVFIVEDIIASGESILDIVDALNDRGARHIYVAATFALFTEGVDRFNRYYEEGRLRRLFSTNLTYRHEDLGGAEWHVEVDMSPLLAAVIDKMNHDESISDLFDATQKIHALLRERTRT